jgi:magnesium transporter
MLKKATLLPLVLRYFESDPVAAAHSLETLEEEDAVQVLKAIPTAMSARAVVHLSDSLAARLLQAVPPALFKDIVERLDPRQSASIFLCLPNEVRQRFLETIEDRKKLRIKEFLTYPEASAGRIMSSHFLALHSDLKVKDAVTKIRQLARKGETASYVYVVDRENHLVGVMNMRDMMLADTDVALENVMRRDVFAIDCFMDREKVAHELSSRKYFAAPVVDSENRMLGVVNADQLITDVQEEASEDMLKMFGAGGDERTFSPMRFSLKKRLPWLFANLATAFLAAWVVSLFQDILAKVTVLAVYLPVAAGQGGNAGAQSLAVVMRGLVMREIPRHRVRQLILKETWIGVINGLACGAVTAAVAFLWQGNPALGLVIGLGMLVNLATAGLSGAAIPMLMKAAGLDPAQCSNIILTTITDVIGFFSFLGFAVLFQHWLV